MKPVISSLEADRWASLFHRLPADLPAEKPLAMPLQAFGECPGRFTVPPTAPLNITDRRLLLFTTVLAMTCAYFGELLRVRISDGVDVIRSEEHTSELQSLMRNSYDAFCLIQILISQINQR